MNTMPPATSRVRNAAAAAPQPNCSLGHSRTSISRAAGIASLYSMFAVVLAVAALVWPTMAAAQVTQRYIMAFSACSSNCQPSSQTVYLAQSNDGVKWSIVPGYPPQTGSVPTLIRRGNTLYYYFLNGPPYVMKYHFATDVWDAPISVQLNDSAPGLGGLVDPTAILDFQGSIVLFYVGVPSTPGNYNPAGCPPGQTTCVQHFRMAVEDAGSDGVSFTAVTKDMVSLPMGGQYQPVFSNDPAVYFDGTRYDFYLPNSPTSTSQIVSLYTSPNIDGPYTLSNLVPDGVLVLFPGGIGSGLFNTSLHQYWSYLMLPAMLNTISMAVTRSLGHEISPSDEVTVATGSSLGLGSNVSVQRPHVRLNVSSATPSSQELTANPESGQAPLGVIFRAYGLTLPTTYTINFGDGTTGALTQDSCVPFRTGGRGCFSSVSHTYTTLGTDTATLLDAAGFQVGTATIAVGNVVRPFVGSAASRR